MRVSRNEATRSDVLVLSGRAKGRNRGGRVLRAEPSLGLVQTRDAVPGAGRVQELWMKVGDEAGGFRLEKVGVREVLDFVLHVEAPRSVEQRIGVLVVDANDKVRSGTRLLLSNAGVEVLGEAADYREAIPLAFQLCPDVVIIDTFSTGANDVVAIEAIKRELPKTNVVVLTSREDVDLLVKSVMAGAVGYIVKGTRRGDLLAAIQAAAGGATVIDKALLLPLIQRIAGGTRPAENTREALSVPPRLQQDRLTKREEEVLGLIVAGFSNKEISERLCVAVDTVKSHVHHIIKKMEVSDRTNAALQALRREMNY